MAKTAHPIGRIWNRLSVPAQKNGVNTVDKTASGYGRGTKDDREMTRGGFTNPATGSGTAGDKMRYATVLPTRITQREYLEIMGAELWQIKRLINVIAQDMTAKWREFETNDQTKVVDTLIDQEKKHKVKFKVQQLIQSGRQFGTAVMIVVTAEAPMDQPLILERIRPGDLKNLIIVDRFDLDVQEYDWDIYSDTFGKPIRYLWNGGRIGRQYVHTSRVLRYDAEVLPERHGHSSSAYDEDWGLSVIVQCLLEVFRDEDMSASVQAQMLRAGVLVVQSDNVNQMLAGGLEGGEGKTLEQVLNDFESGVRSNRMIVVSSENDVSFLAPNFQNMGDIMDRMAGRLAAAFDIPQTRLWGASPQGLNATGESDEIQYSDMIGSLQEAKLNDLMYFIDFVLAADAGLPLTTIPEWSWVPYRKEDEKKIAEISKIKAEALGIVHGLRAITENEIRASLTGDPVFGELETWDDEMLEQMLNDFFEEDPKDVEGVNEKDDDGEGKGEPNDKKEKDPKEAE